MDENVEAALMRAAEQIQTLRADYERACKLVADMHAAAMGSVVGPKLGAVEDVAALRAALERLIACYSVSHSPQTRQDAWEQAKRAVGAA